MTKCFVAFVFSILISFPAFSLDPDKEKEIDNALWQFNMIEWKTHLYNLEQQNDKDKCKILFNKKYDSSLNVIGQAIADCCSMRKEFENVKTDKIIRFEASHKNGHYTVSNWLAVLMYNFVAYNLIPEFKSNTGIKAEDINEFVPRFIDYIAKNYDKDGLLNDDDIGKLNAAGFSMKAYYDELRLYFNVQHFSSRYDECIKELQCRKEFEFHFQHHIMSIDESGFIKINGGKFPPNEVILASNFENHRDIHFSCDYVFKANKWYVCKFYFDDSLKKDSVFDYPYNLNIAEDDVLATIKRYLESIGLYNEDAIEQAKKELKR